MMGWGYMRGGRMMGVGLHEIGLVLAMLQGIPYSGKFSLVQIFAEKRPDSSEEIFAVFIFADARRCGHTPTS